MVFHLLFKPKHPFSKIRKNERRLNLKTKSVFIFGFKQAFGFKKYEKRCFGLKIETSEMKKELKIKPKKSKKGK
ncbi:hypothetical protein [Methanimicrococcus blatticola]|uniref:hypothetical protein n=1 Tax=Methanimicrococcus blatticola TaxID=91560 RepID=UPI0010605E5C|nr:hypothetical protein [Methanimicrococcus blatticola]MBZ3935471.1 hypothetical protein [Methanimicrococcus blatticola]MCC2509114.1 hypothetical protein [Methanimicrococcus blatticola]